VELIGPYPKQTTGNEGSSAFVFSYDGQSILFGADAHAKILMENLAQITPTGEEYLLTACKLSHHGSRRNVTTNLVRALECSQWWFSTNGVRFLHPNRESIARVLVYGNGPRSYTPTTAPAVGQLRRGTTRRQSTTANSDSPYLAPRAF
jgi:hypothetical protein